MKVRAAVIAISALAVVFLVRWIATQIAIDSCLDQGGLWIAEIEECECTYEERGNYSINPTAEELAKCEKEVSRAEGPRSTK